MRLFARLQKKLAQYLDKVQVEKIYQAYLFAEEAHKNQTRSSGEPYISHPVAVASVLADFHLDPETIMAALLHDVMEDTVIDKALLAEKFGQSVAELIDGVSKLTQIQFETKAEAQAENFRKMILAMAKDVRVILVKLADRLHNMRTLESLRPEKRRRIAQETLDIYTPLANRLGMHSLRIELEDLSFAASYPDRFKILSKAMKRLQGNRKGVVEAIEKALKGHFNKHHLRRFIVLGRQKHLYSIYKKMKHKHLPLSEIMDVYAFRIIVSSIDDCYRALGMVHSLYKPVPERFKDYIAIPKVNGYQSLHTTLFGPYGVPIEIQIRTKEMDEIANSGIAAHWIYHVNKNGSKFIADQRTQAWLEGLLELQTKASSSVEFIENVKIDLFPDEVYVFTPKGEIMELPRGATIVDFAYAVHSDIGNRCIAGKIDRHYAPLHMKLRNGQTVEIVTSAQAMPKASWLNFVVTSKAKSNIRHFVNRAKQAQMQELGEKLFLQTLLNAGVSFGDISDERKEKFLKEIDADWSAIYESIALGKRTAHLVVRLLLANNEEILKEKLLKSPMPIIGAEGLLITYATCCFPIPGDSILGFTQGGQGLVVHRADCLKIVDHLADPEHYYSLSWKEEINGEFKAEIRMETYNHRGVLAEITQAISSTGANIEDLKIIDRSQHYNTVVFVLGVLNRDHLERCLRRLRQVPAVQDVQRSGE